MENFTPEASARRPSAKEKLELRVSQELDIVETLVKNKKYSLAMKKLKWVFANSEDSFLLTLALDPISALVRNYAPAKVAVRRWRNDKEKLIISRRADRQVIDEWITLNQILKERKRTFEVLTRQSEEADSDDCRQLFTYFIWKQLVRQRRYSLLESNLRSLGLSLLSYAMKSECDRLFPNHLGVNTSRWERNWNKRFHLEFMREDGCLTYEVALALGEKKAAAVFAEKILSVETNDAMFARLIRAAIRARDYEEAVSIYRTALETFSKRRLSKSTKMLKTMPKTKLAKLAL